MLHADPLVSRPTLTTESLLVRALDVIGRKVETPSEIWRRLTETYVVDLDAVAALLPRSEPEPIWLPVRD